MENRLVIVESPNKIKKIQSYLSETESDNVNWIVLASVGHIRNLKIYGTEKRLGIDLETMEPSYILDNKKKETIEKIINGAKKASKIYIATDPDREGESIGWHIKEVIKESIPETKNVPQIERINFNEITKKALEEALKNPSSIDMDLVKSQEARRILDRMIGFRFTALVKQKVEGQSAGRVKSVVLKLIVEREDEIKQFKPDFWWTINGKIDDVVINNSTAKYREIKYDTFEEAQSVIEKLTGNFIYVDSRSIKKTINPPKPLEMATYLMGMYSTFGINNSSATRAIQSLYEEGLITYPRTDSTRISSQDFLKSIQKNIETTYGKEYWKGSPIAVKPKTKTKTKNQDAHEAIRPTNLSKHPSTIKGLKTNELKAYTLIYFTTLKSFMTSGLNESISELYEDNKQYFVIKKSIVIEPGFRKVDGVKPTKITAPEKSITIEKKLIEIEKNQTHPPKRYNFASIIKKMKQEGIGRPSTYSSVTQGLLNYHYLTKDTGAFVPTELAYDVNNLLLKQGSFNDIINVNFTNEMEDTLDLIAKGESSKSDFLKKFWKEFEPRIDKALEELPKKPPRKTGKQCPLCGRDLIIKRGRFGEFIGCEGFPECKYISSMKEKPKMVPSKLGVCPNCGSDLVVRKNRFRKNYFIGCSKYPECKTILDEEKTKIIFEKMGIENEVKKKN